MADLFNFDHLTVDDEPDRVAPEKFNPADADSTTPTQVVEGKLRTLDLFASLGVVDDAKLETITEEDRRHARAAFSAVVDPKAKPKESKKAALALRTPMSAAYASTMLQAYDWDYVAQTANIRSFVVTKLIDEANGPETKHRLRALELLGKVSGVDLFETRVQVSITQAPQAEIEKRLAEKLKYLEAIDVQTREVFDERGTKTGTEEFIADPGA
jgi:hypothetical protein